MSLVYTVCQRISSFACGQLMDVLATCCLAYFILKLARHAFIVFLHTIVFGFCALDQAFFHIYSPAYICSYQ